MKSRAALGTHPLHPVVVQLPIGAFFLALVADLVHAVTKNPLFYDFAVLAIGVGIFTALLAAVLGLIEEGFERPVDVKIGPDGLAYVLDFGVFHPSEKTMRVFPKTGRVYRIEPVPAR